MNRLQTYKFMTKIHKVSILTRYAQGKILPKYTCQSYISRKAELSGNWGLHDKMQPTFGQNGGCILECSGRSGLDWTMREHTIYLTIIIN